MKDNIKQTIYEVEKLAIKLKKKVKRNDLEFTIQVSLSTVDPGQIYYSLRFTSMVDGVAPMTFIKKSPEDLVEALKAQLDNLDEEAVERAYHAAQIEHASRTITFHEERLEEMITLKQGVPEAEIVEDGTEK